MNGRNRGKAHAKRQVPSLLDEVLERRMLLYVLAAGATLAGASAAQAKVVFTRSHTELRGPIDLLSIDLNNDGVTDFTLRIQTYSSVAYTARLTARGVTGGNSCVAYERFAMAFSKGARIGAGETFDIIGQMASSPPYGNFNNTSNRFLGVRFRYNNAFHYAWIGFRQVKTAPYNRIQAKVVGWAYETESNKPIITGDKGKGDSDSIALQAGPTSLQLLAAGHTAIAERRRRIAG